MESLRDIVARQQATRPTYYDDPEKDRMIALVLELAEEICVLRDRLEDCQQQAAAGASCDDATLDSLMADPETTQQRLARHTAFFEKVLKRFVPEPESPGKTPA